MLPALFLLLCPVGIIFLVIKWSRLEQLGVVTLTFLAGIIIAVLLHQFGLTTAWKATQSSILDVSIALALPMLIFFF